MNDEGSFLIPRRATARLAEGRSQPAELVAWREVGAYVLLADPGAGKTEALKLEARATTGGQYVTARDFVSLSSRSYEPGTTLFIDALDEMRASSPSRDAPLDAIRQRLDALNRPRFRLACREADWIDAVDADALRAVAPDGELIELRLESLNEEEIRTLLRHWPNQVPDADAFWEQAEHQHLTELLGNPLILDLMVNATRGGNLPATRGDTYRLACEHLASEHNKTHRAAARQVRNSLDITGLLFAVLLLSGAEALTREPLGSSGGKDVTIDTIAKELGSPVDEAVLASKLFLSDGERRLPRHRTIAEYLAAAAIARRIADGLPVGRVLALMSGFDGGIVEPLRGLHAWLAAHCASERDTLIDRDPLGVVLYGDVRQFPPSDKRKVFDALGREAQRFAWFRNGDWAAHPFGALGTPDMRDTFAELLRSGDRSFAHLALLDCVLDAVCYGDALPDLKPPLERVVRDNSYGDRVRGSALRAWLAQSQTDVSAARVWLEDMLSGTIEDQRDELVGLLLNSLYPDHVSPAEVMRYFHLPKAGSLIGSYRLFWDAHLLARTPHESRAILADQFAALQIDRSNLNADSLTPEIIGQLISAALEESGERESAPRIFRWLRAGLDSYGFAALKGRAAEGVRDWLSTHPSVQKGVFAYALGNVEIDPKDGQRHYWPCEQLLYRAKRPGDWYRWLLHVAAGSDIEPLAKYCFDNAAHAAIEPSLDYDITMEDVEAWVDENKLRWPQAADWREQAWSRELGHWQGRELRHKREYEAKHLQDRERRRRDLAQYADAIPAGTAPAGLMHHLALAYRGRFTDIHGETPESRIQDYLVGNEADVASAMVGLKATLSRSDLPTVADIFKLYLEQREHYIRPACLVGAELASHDDSAAPLSWSDELASRLVAFWLTDGTGEVPAWYTQLATHRPAMVASVLVQFGRLSIRKRPEHSITGVWSWSQSDDLHQLAQAVLPELLTGFPARATEAQLRTLNHDFLPAAARHLDRSVLGAIASRRLGLKSLDAGQRIAWLVATLSLDPNPRSHELMEFVGSSQTRAVQLGATLAAQTERHFAPLQLPVKILARVILLLAPHAKPAYSAEGGWVTDLDRRRDLVHGFIRRLSASTDEAVASELVELRRMPTMKPWALALDSAKSDHARVVRAARFRHASPESIAHTLANLAPANASDLLALALDQLRGLGAQIRGDDTNSLQLFWRETRNGLLIPKMENDCRDVLLGKLRPLLSPLSVHVEKEASAANDTRADLRISSMIDGRRVVVPIEIKKEDHSALWVAWHEQLEGRYVTDPAAQGAGLYLVLWFGHKPRSSPQGQRPRSAHELEELIRACIPADARTRIAVCVLDLSQPRGVVVSK
ncbi:MAG: hypothetical protein ABI605_17985 [Rhizobacter sp.]